MISAVLFQNGNLLCNGCVVAQDNEAVRAFSVVKIGIEITAIVKPGSFGYGCSVVIPFSCKQCADGRVGHSVSINRKLIPEFGWCTLSPAVDKCLIKSLVISKRRLLAREELKLNLHAILPISVLLGSTLGACGENRAFANRQGQLAPL